MAPRSVDYEKIHAELNERLLAVTTDFAISHGLQPPTKHNLRQMDTTLPHVAAQLLWFGMDVWPSGIDGTISGHQGNV